MDHLGNGPFWCIPPMEHSGNEQFRCKVFADHQRNAAEVSMATRGSFNSLAFPKWNPAGGDPVEATNSTTMNVHCIRAGVKDLPSGALISKTLYIEEKMAGNPHFPNPTPSLATIAAARVALEYAFAASFGGGFAAVALRWVRHAELEKLMVYLAKYVMSAAPGDIGKQITSGFEPRNPPVRITSLIAPSFLNAKRGASEGRVKLGWDRIHGARTYQVFVNDGNILDESAWHPIAFTTRIRTEILGLEPGRMHHFRVRAILAAGEGPFSQVTSARA